MRHLVTTLSGSEWTLDTKNESQIITSYQDHIQKANPLSHSSFISKANILTQELITQLEIYGARAEPLKIPILFCQGHILQSAK